MKQKLLIFGFFIIVNFWLKAQKFRDPELQQSVSLLNDSQTASEFENLFNTFSTADTLEKWQAKYYAAVSLYLKTNFLLNNFPSQPLKEPNNLALKYAEEALELQKNNAELTILLGLIHYQRIQILNTDDPQKEIDLINDYITKANVVLKNNPRLTYLKFCIAENSNDKNKALQLNRKANKELESSLKTSVNWGRQLIQNN